MKYLICAIAFLVAGVSFSSDQNPPVHFAQLALLAKLQDNPRIIKKYFKKLPDDKDTKDYIELSIDAIIGLPINTFQEKIKSTSDTTLRKLREDLGGAYHMSGLMYYGVSEAPSLCGCAYLNSCCCRSFSGPEFPGCVNYSCLTTFPGLPQTCPDAVCNPWSIGGSHAVGLTSLLTNYVFFKGMKKIASDSNPKKEYIDEINKLLISRNGPEPFTLKALC